MIHFTTNEIIGWIMLLFWPFVRVLAFVGVAPVLGSRVVPSMVKISVAFAITLVLVPTLPPMPDIAPFSLVGAVLLVKQILIGVSLGLVMRVIFAAVQAAGAFVGLQMGLGFATFYSNALGVNSMILSQLLYTFAVLFFLAFNGHLMMLAVLAQTFQILPIGAGSLTPAGWESLAMFGATIFTAGTMLALPLIATLLTINAALGIMNRAAPQFTIFSVGFPLTLLSGLVVLWFMVPELGRVFRYMFMLGLDAMRTLAYTLAGG